MSRSIGREWLHLTIICIILFVLPGIIFSKFHSFILDDAFITYRYAENLVTHGTLAWNAGEDPVEGYTSFLWVMLNASAIAIGVPPETASRSISFFSLFLIIIWFIRNTRNFSFDARIVFVSAIALNVPLNLHATQGMETAFAATLLFFSSVAAIRVVESTSQASIAAWFFAAMAAALTRPETVVFSFFVSASIAIVFVRRRSYQSLSNIIVISIPFILFGALYLLWRYYYFGNFLPNTAYIKSTTGLSHSGVISVRDFLVFIAAPYLLFIIWNLSVLKNNFNDVAPVYPVVFGLASQLLYFSTVEPIQAQLYRFTIVLLPSVVLLFWFFEKANNGKLGLFRHNSLRVITVTLFILWPLMQLPEVLSETGTRSQLDRVLVGKELRGIKGTLFTTESGALPYYSKWRSIDLLGLNSEKIAHEGLTVSYLEEIQPDLIMLLTDKLFTGDDWPITTQYMRRNNFVAVAAIAKSYFEASRDPLFHVYFANQDSPLFEEIVARLRAIPELHYLSLADTLRHSDFPYIDSQRAEPETDPGQRRGGWVINSL